MMQYAKPSLATLFSSLAGDTKNLIRQEVQLAKTELTEKLSKMGKNAAMLAIGGFVAYAGLIVFLIGLGWLLGFALEKAGVNPTLARFIGLSAMGLIVAIVGYLLLNKALKSFSSESLAPERTLQTLQEFKGGPVATQAVDLDEASAHEELTSEDMQQRVEATETRMGDTLEELGHRFSPQHLKTQVKDTINANPYRAGLLAAGVGLASGLFIRSKFSRAAC